MHTETNKLGTSYLLLYSDSELFEETLCLVQEADLLLRFTLTELLVDVHFLLLRGETSLVL